jgi:peptidyl-prolyl cis-trans isomerase C
MADNGYLEADFRRDLARSIAAAWMRDQVAAAVPQAAEQVHARQILVYQREQAEEALAQLQAGQDFATLAARYNAITAGDLGWFPRGYLLDPALDEAVFSLEPGEYSSILETPTGFHIIQVIERDAERALEAEARLTLQTQALQSWLEEQRMESDIQIFDP